MKVTKAPSTHHFKHGFVSFSKDRKTKELEYKIMFYSKDNVLFELIGGNVSNERYLKHLQKIESIDDVHVLIKEISSEGIQSYTEVKN